MQRLVRMLRRLVGGESVLVVRQSPARWDAQFEAGKWSYLTQKIPPNTHLLVERIKARTFKEKRLIRVCDVGCGNGGLFYALQEDKISVEYVGIDFSPMAIDQAQQKFPGMRFIVGDIENDIPNDLGRFDIIVFNEVLYYVSLQKTFATFKKFIIVNETQALVSMYRTWRTKLIWFKLRRFLIEQESFAVRGTGKADKETCWDVKVMRFK